MKIGPYLLINLIVVGGGLFLYDSLKGDSPARVSDSGAFDPLQADDVGQPPARDPADATPAMLSGGGPEALASRVGHLESILRDLRREIARTSASSSTGSGGAALPAGGQLPSLASEDYVEGEEPTYNEKTLTTIESYMDEINRRKTEERQRNRVTAEIKRQGLDLTEGQTKDVVEITLAYQTKSRELVRKGWPRDETGRTGRKEAYKALQDEYSASIHELLPAADAEKIMESRIARGLGFFAGGSTSRRAVDRGNRRKNGSDGGKNRNR